MENNWETKKLREVCDIGAGNSAPQKKELFDAGKYPFFRTSDVGKIRFGVIDDSADKLNEIGIEKLHLYKKGTLLFPKSGASTFLNHRVLMAMDGYVSSHLATLKAKDNILSDRFLLYFSSTIDSRNLMQDQNYPSLRLSDIQEINIFLPSFHEQKRIVKVLDEIFEKTAKAKENAKKNLQNSRELFESYLQSVFAKPGDGWEEKVLGEVCNVRDGTHDSPQYVPKGIPFVTQKNITKNGLDIANIKRISLADHESFYKRSNVSQGDIIISMIGANRGMACLVDESTIFSIKNVGLVKANSKVNQDYLLYFLKSPRAKEYVSEYSKGGAQEFIGLTELRKFPVLFAPLLEQKRIVAKLDALSTETKKLEAIYQQKLADLEELKKSILQKAFNGEL